MIRPLVAALLLLLPACSLLEPAPPPASPTGPAPGAPASPAPAAPAPRPAPAAPGDATAQPPVSARWTLHLPSVAGRPWTRQHFEVKEDGSAIWESDTGGGDGDVDEALTDRPNPARKVVRCGGRLGPASHRKLVETARRAMTPGCTSQAPPIDAAMTTIAVTWEGVLSSCTVERTGAGYAAFEKARAEVVALLCKR